MLMKTKHWIKCGLLAPDLSLECGVYIYVQPREKIVAETETSGVGGIGQGRNNKNPKTEEKKEKTWKIKAQEVA